MSRSPALTVALAAASLLVSPGGPSDARAEEVTLDGTELVRGYQGFIERYRRTDPASHPLGGDLVRQAAGWGLDLARLTAALAAMPPPSRSAVVRLGLPARLTAPPRTAGDAGACLIARSARDCAEALKAAALLHTDVATSHLSRGARQTAAVHLSIAGWLLWHLPQEAQDDAFVRDWLLAMSSLLLGEGSLSSARRLGEIGLRRFPNDAALLLAMARATEAMGSLCYEPGGKPVGGDDCAEVRLAFDGRYPRPPLRARSVARRSHLLGETERRLRTLLEAQPASSEVHLRLGRVLAQRVQIEEAIRELGWVVENGQDPDERALAHLLLGRLAEARGDAPGAIHHAHAALAIAPRSQSGRLALASALLAAGDRRAAAEAVSGLPSAPPPPTESDPWVRFLQGSLAAYTPARAALYARVALP